MIGLYDARDGQEFCVGLPARTAHRSAQSMANRIDRAVELFDGKDSYIYEPWTIEVEEIDGHPWVIYGGHDFDLVEHDGVEYIPDWSRVVALAPSGTHFARYRAPLLRVQ